MAYDALAARAVALELKELIGTRVERVTQSRPDELALTLYGPGKHYLFFSANAAHARLHLVEDLPRPMDAATFAMLLRRHLEGCQLLGVTLPHLERVFTLRFQAPPIRGQREYHLVAEIMGRHSNLILVDPATGSILDGIKRYSHAVSRYREVLPGQPYIAPPPSRKRDPVDLREEELYPLLLAGGMEKPLGKALIQGLNGYGPPLAREVAARAGLDVDLPVEFCGSFELSRLWQAMEEIKEVIRQNAFKPSLVLDRRRAVAFAAIELKQYPGLEQVHLPQMNQVIDRFYREQQEQELWARKKNRLEQMISEQMKRWLKKIALQEEALTQAAEADNHRLAGQVITMSMHQLKRGATELVAPNPYNPEEILHLELNPAYSPADNAQIRFRKYRKAKAQAEQAGLQLAQARQELDYWESVKESLDRVESLEMLEEIERELIPAPERSGASKRKKTTVATPTPLKLVFRGYMILVGRNNRQNDYLTTRLSRPEDLWLHAKDIPGSHVVVRNPSGEPVPPQVIETAAGLAAFHSQGRLSRSVPVDYTLVKHVHKSKGARAGMVYYTHQRTLTVRPIAPEALGQAQTGKGQGEGERNDN